MHSHSLSHSVMTTLWNSHERCLGKKRFLCPVEDPGQFKSKTALSWTHFPSLVECRLLASWGVPACWDKLNRKHRKQRASKRPLLPSKRCWNPVSKVKEEIHFTKKPEFFIQQDSWQTWTRCRDAERGCQHTQCSPVVMLFKLPHIKHFKCLYKHVEPVWTTLGVYPCNVQHPEKREKEADPAERIQESCQSYPQFPKPDTSPPIILIGSSCTFTVWHSS